MGKKTCILIVLLVMQRGSLHSSKFGKFAKSEMFVIEVLQLNIIVRIPFGVHPLFLCRLVWPPCFLLHI